MCILYMKMDSMQHRFPHCSRNGYTLVENELQKMILPKAAHVNIHVHLRSPHFPQHQLEQAWSWPWCLLLTVTRPQCLPSWCWPWESMDLPLEESHPQLWTWHLPMQVTMLQIRCGQTLVRKPHAALHRSRCGSRLSTEVDFAPQSSFLILSPDQKLNDALCLRVLAES